MKIIISVLAASFFAASAFASVDVPLTRVFKVDFKKARGNDGDTKVCDDNFFTFAELQIPAMRGLDVKAVLAQCPSMKPVRFERVVQDNGLYTRVKLQGDWNCEYVIEMPRRSPSDAKKVFTVSLSDGC